jgi:GNAT superfamily N-acetyltransferase
MSAYSAVESSRFGLRIGRIDASDAALASVERTLRDERLDVLIVRAPAEEVHVPARLAALDGFRAIPADTLMYWERRDLSRDEAGAAASVTNETDPARIEELVRSVFAGYHNHYSANPLLSSEHSLDGYCEWATSLVGSGGATCSLIESEAAVVDGFGIVDWTPDIPDIRLAGIVPSARGRGAYRRLLVALQHEAARRGHSRLRISTQAHNTRPMRAWAELGWRPIFSLTTLHLVREELLTGG